MESKKTTGKTSGSQRKSEAKISDQLIYTSKTPRSESNASSSDTTQPSPEAIAAKKLFGAIKETLHGETDRKNDAFKFCNWAIPEATKKDHCQPINCNDVIIFE